MQKRHAELLQSVGQAITRNMQSCKQVVQICKRTQEFKIYMNKKFIGNNFKKAFLSANSTRFMAPFHAFGAFLPLIINEWVFIVTTDKAS